MKRFQHTLDDGLKSRKLWFSVMTCLLIFVGYLANAKWPLLNTLYSIFTGSLLAASATYLTGNLVHRSINNKIPGGQEEESESFAPPTGPPGSGAPPPGP